MFYADALSFVLLWVTHLKTCCSMTWEEAFGNAVRLANIVISDHNEAVIVSRNNGGYYNLDTGCYSDNQCVFSGFLDRTRISTPLIAPYTGSFRSVVRG